VARHSIGRVFVIRRNGLTGAGKSSFSLHHAQCRGAAVSILWSHKSNCQSVSLGDTAVVGVEPDGFAFFGVGDCAAGLPDGVRRQATAGKNPAGVGAVSLPGRVRSICGGVVGAFNP